MYPDFRLEKRDCFSKKCFADECETGYHLVSRFDSDNNEWTTCEEDTHDACGSINKKCGKDEFCGQGQCKHNCLAGEVICSGSCINPNTSSDFCGADASCTSYIPCSDYEECIDGACILTSCQHEEDSLCTENDQNVCINTHGDNPNHCGACGTTCSDLDTAQASGCAHGQCTYICNEGKVNCGSETDPLCLPEDQLNNDPMHCGKCETVCPGNAFCENGQCILSSCTGNECLFNNVCTNQNDHCGTQCINCNTANHASAGICQGGTCTITAYASGFHLTDQGNCEANSATTCPNGQATGTVNCNTIDQYTMAGVCTNGNCVATQCQSDAHLKDGKCVPDALDKCGVSETNCPQLAGWLSGSCENGKCTATSCQSGFCLNTLNHECTSTQTSTTCGIDGGACKSCSVKQVCSAGSCVEKHCSGNVCQQKTGDNQEDICQNDDTHCGSECLNCNEFTSNAVAGTCTPSGTCQLTECKQYYHIYNNTCEYTDMNNCGEHGRACNVANAYNTCWANFGQCTFSCHSDAHTYNGGCELNDTENCGTHGNQCPSVVHGTKTCSAGKCSFTCDPDFHPYDYSCEPDDLENCGAHDHACNEANATNSCTGGRCTFSCLPDTHTYDGGCELNDTENCGAHGRECPPLVNGTNTCTDGSCNRTCKDGYASNGYLDGDINCVPAMISLWDVTSDNLTIRFPIREVSGTVIIRWDDGKTDTITPPNKDGYIQHTYSRARVYTITVIGTISKWSCEDGQCDQLTEIKSYGDVTFGISAFYYAQKLQRLPESMPRFYNNKTIRTFYMAKVFNQDISNWDTSNITDMNNMFSGAEKFNQDISSWNTANVTNMSGMFFGARSFDQPLNSWNTANVTNMSYMFAGATNFNKDISNWNTANVTNMSGMFYGIFGATSFDQPLNNWDTSNVTNMSYMFYGDTSFNQSLNNWNTGNVTDMSYMFYEATRFNQEIGNWNTANVSNMSYMFYGATSFNKELNNWNTANVTDMSYMFRGTRFNKALNNWNTANVTNMKYMFYNDSSFNQELNNWNTANVTDMSYMFYSATSFNKELNNWNTANVTDMSYMFHGATSFDKELNSWNTGKVKNMSAMFYNATKFNQELNSWNTGNVTDMSYMLNRTTRFNQPLNSWNTANVTNMKYMFYLATGFNQPLDNWNISNVTVMTDIFADSGLTSTNYCALFTGPYSSIWENFIGKLGKSFSCP